MTAVLALFVKSSLFLSHTDSVCFADNPELHRIASSTSGTRFAPTRFARIERALQPIQSESVSGVGGDLQQQTYADLLDTMTDTYPELRDALSAGGQGIFNAYLDDAMKAEYNALKHSNRVNPASIQGRTTVGDMDWQRTMIFEQLHKIETQGLTGHVLQWSVHPVELTTLYAQIDLCLRWLDVLHWALRRLHGVDTATPHPGFPPLEDVTKVWASGEAVMVVTQELTSRGRLLEDGRRRTAVPLSEDDSLPHGITRREI